MKLRLAATAFATLAMAQVNPPELKHVVIPPLNGSRPVSLTARNIERGVEYPSIVKLSGNVEIKSPFCRPAEKVGLVCYGDMIVRADEAQFHEDTGQIEARGNVVVTPIQP